MRNGWSCRVLQALSNGTKISSDGPNWRPACLVYFRSTEILEPKVDYLKEVHFGWPYGLVKVVEVGHMGGHTDTWILELMFGLSETESEVIKPADFSPEIIGPKVNKTCGTPVSSVAGYLGTAG